MFGTEVRRNGNVRQKENVLRNEGEKSINWDTEVLSRVYGVKNREGQSQSPGSYIYVDSIKIV